MQIPKRIFYVWDGPLPEKVVSCIASWRNVMPDYEIIEVNNASPYFDFNGELERCSWFRTVFERKLWAYVADYIRVKVLLDHGGIYCDTDITALKSFDSLLSHEFFAGFESPTLVNLSVFGCRVGHPFLSDFYAFYQQEIWEKPIYTIPEITTWLLKEKYGCILYDSRKIPATTTFRNITLYPEKSFYPYSYKEMYDDRCVTGDTYTIHWWGASWVKPDILQWLNTKHLAGKCASPEKAPITEYLRLTPRELKIELAFGGFVIIQGFKHGCCHTYEFLGLPLLTIQWWSDKAVYFLFNRIKIATRKRK